MVYTVECVGASINPLGERILSVLVRCPRFILPQLLTHRVFSRNSRSNRAIRTCDVVEGVLDDNYTPDFVEKVKGNGMVGGSEIVGETLEKVRELWYASRDMAINTALEMERLGVSKQHCNRVLEPYMINTMLITSTEWSNFFNLRIAEDAQPEIQIIASQIKQIWDNEKFNMVEWGGIHRVFNAQNNIESVERAARVSYLNHEGTTNGKLYHKLLESRHLSPFEHTAYACKGVWDNFIGWKQLRRII